MLAGSPQLCPPGVENTFALFFKSRRLAHFKSTMVLFAHAWHVFPVKGSYAAKSVKLMLAVH